MLAIQPVYEKWHSTSLVMAGNKTQFPFEQGPSRSGSLHRQDASGCQATGFGCGSGLSQSAAADRPMQDYWFRKLCKSFGSSSSNILKWIWSNKFQVLAVGKCD